MKTITFKKHFLFTICFLLVSTFAIAQESPRETATGAAGSADIKIEYGAPSVRGRKIWGDLVPYGQIWRTGANPVTEITLSKDIKVQGRVLHAGKYSIFTIPGQDEWKVIFNSETGQWGIKDDGSANDDPSKDVLTVTAKAEKSKEFHEKMTFVIDGNGFTLLWENLALPVIIDGAS
jgi:hypothetical protein